MTVALIVLSTDRVIETVEEEATEKVFLACFTIVAFPAEETLCERFTRMIRVTTAVDVAVSVFKNALEGVRKAVPVLVAVRDTGMRRRAVATLVAVPEIVLETRLEIVAETVEEIARIFPACRVIVAVAAEVAVSTSNFTFVAAMLADAVLVAARVSRTVIVLATTAVLVALRNFAVDRIIVAVAVDTADIVIARVLRSVAVTVLVTDRVRFTRIDRVAVPAEDAERGFPTDRTIVAATDPAVAASVLGRERTIDATAVVVALRVLVER